MRGWRGWAASAGVVWACLGPARPAGAQAATSQASPAPAQTDVPTITVTAAPPADTSSIDRKRYSLANDLQRSAGSLADVLRNIPSVSVDPQGNVSLRGDPSVTILVDGKPSALFSDQSRAETVQQLPADSFERVEVITSPSAAFRPDGAGGIINLISRKTPHAAAGATTVSGGAKLNVGTGGRSNGGLNGSFAVKGLSATGGASFRHSVSRVDGADQLTLPDPISGAPTPAVITARMGTVGDSQSVNGALDYDLDAETRLSASANHFQDRSHRADAGRYLGPLAGPLALDYAESGFWHGHFSQNGASVGLARKRPGEDHEVSLQLTVSEDHVFVSTGSAYAYHAPVQPGLFQDLSTGGDDLEMNLKAEAKTPTPFGKLTTGYDLRADQNRLQMLGVAGPAPGDTAPVSGFTDDVRFDQQVHALYATLDETRGALTLQPGLRLEVTALQLDQATQGRRDTHSYVGAYPSLHLSYALDDDQQLKASYGRRVQRPGIYQLDPFRREVTPTAYQSGNPDLKPETTDAVELGYEFRRKATDYQATLYDREKTGVFTAFEQQIAPTVLLTTEQNLGRRRDAGVELVAARDLTPTLTLNLSGDLFWSRVDAANLGVPGRRSAVLWSGRMSLTWSPTKADVVQLSAVEGGRQLTAQGYRESLATVNLGWRHTFDKRLAAVVTLQDPFDSYRLKTVVDTPALRDAAVQTLHIRTLFVGFTYGFGGPGKPPAAAFDFGGDPAH